MKTNPIRTVEGHKGSDNAFVIKYIAMSLFTMSFDLNFVSMKKQNWLGEKRKKNSKWATLVLGSKVLVDNYSPEKHADRIDLLFAAFWAVPLCKSSSNPRGYEVYASKNIWFVQMLIFTWGIATEMIAVQLIAYCSLVAAFRSSCNSSPAAFELALLIVKSEGVVKS